MKLGIRNSYIPPIIGCLIVLEGIVNILMAILPQFDLPLDRLLFNYLNYMRFFELQKVSALIAIFAGIAFVMLGRGLAKGRRSAWKLTITCLLFTIINSVFPSLFLPTFVYTFIMLILLIIFHASFKLQDQPLRLQQWVALLSVTLVLLYGTIGTYLLRAQYSGIHDWIDAIYYCLVTYTTIGYGDIVPLTDNAKIFTCSMIILGVSTFVAATGIILGPVFEKRIKGVFTMVSRLNQVHDHTIIFGVNPMSLHTAKLLQTQSQGIVFLDTNPRALSDAEYQGFKVVPGAPSKEDVLNKARLAQANAIVCCSSSDAENLLVSLAAHKIRTKLKAKFRIIARIDEPEHSSFAKTVGADDVLSPSTLMGNLISKELSPKE